MSRVLRLNENGSKPEPGKVSLDLKFYVRDWEKLVVEKGKLFLKGGDSRHLVLGNLGRDRTLAFFKEIFYWPGTTIFVEDNVKDCGRCLGTKAPNLPERAQMKTIISSQPLE